MNNLKFVNIKCYHCGKMGRSRFVLNYRFLEDGYYNTCKNCASFNYLGINIEEKKVEQETSQEYNRFEIMDLEE